MKKKKSCTCMCVKKRLSLNPNQKVVVISRIIHHDSGRITDSILGTLSSSSDLTHYSDIQFRVRFPPATSHFENHSREVGIGETRTETEQFGKHLSPN